jgi:hypothetical protein
MHLTMKPKKITREPGRPQMCESDRKILFSITIDKRYKDFLINSGRGVAGKVLTAYYRIHAKEIKKQPYSNMLKGSI